MGKVRRFLLCILFSTLIFSLESFNLVSPWILSVTYLPPLKQNNPIDKRLHNPDQLAENNDSSELFRWALAWWKDNIIACNIYLENTGNPAYPDVSKHCGEDILTAWRNTPACVVNTKTGTQTCKGLYLLFIGMSKPEGQIVAPVLSKISTSASQYNCDPWSTCMENPRMVFTIENDQNLQNSHILKIEVNKEITTCKQTSCLLDMPLTDAKGIDIKYWAESANGGIVYERFFKMRNQIISTDTGDRYLFELIGNDWLTSTDAAANIWEMFPGLDTSQASWMEHGEDTTFLLTEEDYAMLAGKLIWYGYVDASGCLDSGLLPNGAADICGQEKAHDQVEVWQNRFNEVILHAAQETNVPPKIIKGLVAQESQFWPMWPSKEEFGYGMMTEKGIDMLLNWNVDYYLDLCNTYYTPDECDDGYSQLAEPQQQFLRGACLISVGTDDEFVLLANILKAACAQTSHLVELITKKKPADLYSYETLWRISLGVYNTGAGCMSDAIKYSWNDYKRAMTWTEFRKHIQPECASAKEYFDWVVFYGAPE